MTRQKGTAGVTFNFEPQVAAPMDSRTLVQTLADLTNENTFLSSDGQSYAYKGMMVVVASDETAENNGLYVLTGTDTTVVANWTKIGEGGGEITTPANQASVFDNSEPVDLFGKAITDVQFMNELADTKDDWVGEDNTLYYIPIENTNGAHLKSVTLLPCAEGAVDIYIGEDLGASIQEGSYTPPPALTKICTIVLPDEQEATTFTFDGTDAKVTYINQDLVNATGYPALPEAAQNTKAFYIRSQNTEQGRWYLNPVQDNELYYWFLDTDHHGTEASWQKTNAYHLGWNITFLAPGGTTYNFDNYLVDNTTQEVRSGVIKGLMDKDTELADKLTTPANQATVFDNSKQVNLFSKALEDTEIANTIPNEDFNYISDNWCYIYSPIHETTGSHLKSFSFIPDTSGELEVFIGDDCHPSAGSITLPTSLTKLCTLNVPSGSGDSTVAFTLDGTDNKVTYINQALVDSYGLIALPTAVADSKAFYIRGLNRDQGTWRLNQTEDGEDLFYYWYYDDEQPQSSSWTENSGLQLGWKIVFATPSSDTYRFDDYITDTTNNTLRSKVLNDMKANTAPFTTSCPTIALGGIAAGTEYLNKPVIEILDALLCPEQFPTLTDPSLALASSLTNLQEIGAELTFDLTATFNRGSINPAYTTSGYRSGLPNKYTWSGASITEDVEHSITTLTDTYSLTDYVIASGDNTWTCVVAYDAGEQAKSNKGNDYETPLAVGTKTKSYTIKGVYPYYANTSAIGTMTKQPLAEMNSTYVEIPFVAETDSAKQAVAFPDDWSTITGIQFYNTLNNTWEWMGGSKANSLTMFTVTTTTYEVNGATINYKLYTFNGAKTGARSLRFFTT